MINVGIIGCGFVGGALKDWLEHNNPECKLFISDPAKGYNDDLSQIDIAFLQIHVPTEDDGTQDLRLMKELISKLPDVPVFVRTTILPGTSDMLSKETGHKVHYMPEFLTERTHIEDFKKQTMVFTVAQYLEGDQAIDMVFRLQPVDRSTVTELETLTIPTSAGAVPLSQVARLSYESENGMIWRRNLLPTITVCGGIGEGVTGNDITQQVYDDLADLRQNLPNGVTIEIGGSLEDSAKTLGYLLEPVPVMLLLMMILLMLQLKDIRKLFIILCTAPLGVTGVMLGLIIFNAPLGFMAELGILALTGIIIRNSVVLIDQIDLHLQAGKSPWESVLESAIVRFRPIMLAALTTILGLIPMFTSPFWNSMAVAIACGLSAATLLTLIVLPVIYAAVFKIKPE